MDGVRPPEYACRCFHIISEKALNVQTSKNGISERILSLSSHISFVNLTFS